MCTALVEPNLEAPSLTLRAPKGADAVRIAEMCGDIAIPRMTTRMPWPYQLEHAFAFVDAVQRQNHDRENTFLIEHARDGVVGCVGVFMNGRLPEIGYWVGRSYWGRGIATEACRQALAWTRDEWRKKVVLAGHFADNPASAAVLTKNGFLYTGDVEIRHSIARGEDTPTRMMVWLA